MFWAVDGNWTEWRAWGPCSRTCGTGTQQRMRTCTKPAPAFGGKNCSGDSRETRSCQTRLCSGTHFINGFHFPFYFKPRLASHADVLRGSSRVPAPRGAGTRDEPLRTSAWEAGRISSVGRARDYSAGIVGLIR